MTIETVRVTRQGFEQLSRLKRHTGIETRNVMCRWAFCASLAEATSPPPREFKGDTPVEMSWKVFGGKYEDLYLALLRQRCEDDGLGTSAEMQAEQLRLHIHRGLGYLAADRNLRSIAELLRFALDDSDLLHDQHDDRPAENGTEA